MNIEQMIAFVVEKEGNKFSFHFPMGASWSQAVAAANDVLHTVCDHMKQAAAQAQEVNNGPKQS